MSYYTTIFGQMLNLISRLDFQDVVNRHKICYTTWMWGALSFLYTRLESLALDIIFEPELGLVNRKRLGDLLRFVYHKLALAVKRILALARVYYPPRRINPNNGQLVIPFEEWW